MEGTSRSFTVGRDTGCDIPIADDFVSRIHAELRVQPDGHIVVIDNHSRNGTAVIRAGKPSRVNEARVSPDDEVQFGEVVFRVAALLEALHCRLPPAASGAKAPRPTRPCTSRPARSCSTSISSAACSATAASASLISRGI